MRASLYVTQGGAKSRQRPRRFGGGGVGKTKHTDKQQQQHNQKPPLHKAGACCVSEADVSEDGNVSYTPWPAHGASRQQVLLPHVLGGHLMQGAQHTQLQFPHRASAAQGQGFHWGLSVTRAV